MNVGQKRVVDLIKKKEVTRLLVASGSRCFASGTEVKTSMGYKFIEDIRVGDRVLSNNILTGCPEYRRVNKVFHNTEQSKQMVIFVFNNGQTINCTIEHELYKEENYTPAFEIARRIMENDKWDKRYIRGVQFGENKNIQLEGYRRGSCDVSIERCQWLFEDYAKIQLRKIQDNKSSSYRCSALDRKSRKQSGSESYKQCEGRQQGREFRVGYSGGKQGAHDEARSSNIQQGFKKRNGDNDGRSSKAYTKSLQQRRGVDSPTMVSKVWSKLSRIARSSFREDLETREINFNDVVEIYFYEARIKTYDLQVDVNHNYTVSRNNIRVSNSGKTFIILWAMVTMAIKFPKSRHLILRKHFNHAKGAIWLDTLPKVLEICYPDLVPHVKTNNTDYYMTFPNGSEIWIGGVDNKERIDKILGKEYLTIFLNECSDMTFDAYETVVTRLAQSCSFKKDGKTVKAKNMLFADENPTSSKHWSKILFIDKQNPEDKTALKDPEVYAYTFIHPSENQENLPDDYIKTLENMSAAKRRRFLDGLFSDGSDNALWDAPVIAKSRVLKAPSLKRIVVSIDPAVTATDKSDETGIVVLGLGIDNDLYILDDVSGIYTPTKWAEMACETYHKWNADVVVGEVNNGGDLIETVLRTHDPYINYKKIFATKNKYTRAEPVAALWYMEEPKAHIVGELPTLEYEMTEWEGKTGDASPNRIDAMVWGATELIPSLRPETKKQQGNIHAAANRYRRLMRN